MELMKIQVLDKRIKTKNTQLKLFLMMVSVCNGHLKVTQNLTCTTNKLHLIQKNILGIYIRKRLGLDQYDEITFEHLKNYGKDYIEITNMGDGLYYADFGVGNSKL